MNKLAEQLSNDIAIRAAQKLAALNGGMEKNAGIDPQILSILSNPSVRRPLMQGLGMGGLGATIGGLRTALLDDDPTISDYVRSMGAGFGIGAGLGGGAALLQNS